MRINAQLIDARNDRHLWASPYERDLRDVLGQAELARAIANQVASELDPQRRRLPSNKNVNTEAYEAYLRGRYWASHAQFTAEGNLNAREHFRRAIELDPTTRMPSQDWLKPTFQVTQQLRVCWRQRLLN